MIRLDARRVAFTALVFALAASGARAHDASIAGPDTLGRGLQDRYAVVLSDAAPEGGLVFQLRSVVATACVLSESETSGGGAQLDVPVDAGHRRGSFWVQAVGAGSGPCEIELTPPPGWTIPGANFLVALGDAHLDLRRIDTARGAAEPPSPFAVVVGVLRANGGGLRYTQRLAAGSCTVRACSTAPALLRVVDEDGNDAGGDACEDASLTAPAKGTTFGALQTVAAPGVTQAGDAPVVASSPDCPFLASDTRTVTVAPETVKVAGGRPGTGRLLGVGHEDEYHVHLSRASTTATTVLVEVAASSQATCAVAGSGTAVGGTSASVPVDAGRSDAAIYVQGLAAGDCELAASAAGYAGSTGWVEVVTPGLAIRELPRSFGAGEPDHPFEVVLGAATPEGRVPRPQAVSPGSAPVGLRVCSSNLAAGAIVASGTPAACVTVQVDPLEDRTGNEAPDAVAFRPATPASAQETTVRAEPVVPDAYAIDEQDVDVAPVAVELRGSDALGSGLDAALQDEYVLTTSRSLAQDTTFQLSATPGRCALWNGSAAVATLQVTIPAGRSRAPVTLLAQPASDGETCTVAFEVVSGQALSAGSHDVEVAPGAVVLSALADRLPLYGDGDGFVVQTRSPDGERQRVRPDETLAGVEVCSDAPDVVKLQLGTSAPAACVTTQIDPGDNQTPRGLLVAVPGNPGFATVTVQAPGFAPDQKTVEVREGTLELSGPSVLGRGLEERFTLKLGPASQDPVTLTLRALPVGPSSTAVCSLSADATIAGGDTLPITIPAGERSTSFVVQALTDTGSDEPCTVVASDEGGVYADAEKEIELVTPGLRLRDLATASYVGAPLDGFRVEIGVPTDSADNLKMVQPVSPQIAPYRVLACSLTPANGVVERADASEQTDCRQADIPAGASSTPDPVADPSGAFAFHPLAQGTATVETRPAAGSPPAETTARGRLDITIAVLVLGIDEAGNVDRVGSGLMDTFRVTLNQAVSSAVSVTLRSDTPDVCRVAANETTDAAGPPTYAVPLTIAKGNRQVNFQLHGLEALPDEDEGNVCELTATSPGLPDATASISIVPAAAKLTYLDTSLAWDSGDERFKVAVGVAETAKDGTTTLQWLQKVRYRAGAPGLLVPVRTSRPDVASLLLDSLPDSDERDLQVVRIETGHDSSRTSGGVADARIKLRPHTPGQTALEVQPDTDPVVDLVVTDAARETVTISGEGLTLSIDSVAVGVGLQSSLFRVQATQAPVSVILGASTPEQCLLALGGTTPGTDTLSFTVPNNLSGGKGEQVFFVQGVSEGSCVLEVSAAAGAPGYAGVTVKDVPVRQPSLQIANLAGGYVVGAANDPFDVQLGVSTDLVSLAEIQAAAPGHPVTVNLGSTTPAVASLVTTTPPASGAAVSVTIPPGSYSTSASGLALDPGSAGTSLVSAQATGFDPIQRSEASVLVSEACGLGFELAPILLGLFALRRRLRGPARV